MRTIEYDEELTDKGRRMSFGVAVDMGDPVRPFALFCAKDQALTFAKAWSVQWRSTAIEVVKMIPPKKSEPETRLLYKHGGEV